MQEGFCMDPWTAMLFFRTCSRYKVTALDARKALLREIVARGRAKYIRDAGTYINGKKIIEVKRGNRDN